MCRGRFLARVNSGLVVLSVYSCSSSFFFFFFFSALRLSSHDFNPDLELFSKQETGASAQPQISVRSTVVLKLNPT
jgi:hypothetical protein